MQDLQIIDKRQLTFDRRIVAEALRHPSRIARRLALPKRAPDLVKLAPDRAQVELVYDSADEATPMLENKFRLTYEQVAAVLIDYCDRASIPLPRASAKSISVENDTLVLCCVKLVRV